MRLPTICEKCSECSDQLGSDTSSCMITIVYIIRALHDQLSQMEKDKYQNQNNELKQLHFQRMARRLQAKAQQATQQPKPQGKRIAPMQNQSQTTKNPNQIYLNSIIYDKRSPEQKNHNVSLINFMHPSFEVSTRVVSKEVEAIMITTYGFETEVFEPIVQTGVPFYVFNRDGEGRQGKIYRNYSGYGNMTVISPPKHQQGYGVFHTKLWLIKFKQFLRVVVCTSNNHLYDWTIWQNAYWYHDCPLKDIKEQSKIEKSGENKSKEKSTEFDNEKDFVQTLKWVIDNMQPSKFDILKEMKVELQNYSFKGINAILIPSLPGRFKGEQLDKIGLGKIRKILKNRQQKMKEPTITINCTSLGKLDEKFIRQVYSSFCPSEGFMNPQKFKLIYPSQLYIENQTCGEAGTLCLVPQNYAKCELKKQIFYKYQQSYFNGVQGGIPHLKTVIVQQKPGQNIVLYIGSHNLTKAAWGTFQKQQSQINCLNEQLGLLFLDYSQDELLRWLPYRYPPEKYSSSDLPYMRTRQ